MRALFVVAIVMLSRWTAVPTQPDLSVAEVAVSAGYRARLPVAELPVYNSD